jgi:hypothetical protein
MIKSTSNNVLLILGVLLIGYGLVGPSLKNIVVNKPVNTVNVVMPLDTVLKENCEKVTDTFKKGSGDKSYDGVKLASLYSDLAKLISLDDNNEVIKNTDEIREANRLAGKLYDLNLEGKYPDLASKTNDVIIKYIGDDNVALDKELRKKAVDAFNGLAWAFYEGSK